MKDKMEDIKKAFAADMADAQADGKAAADASNLPPLSNRGGVQNPKTSAHSKKPLNVTKPIS